MRVARAPRSSEQDNPNLGEAKHLEAAAADTCSGSRVILYDPSSDWNQAVILP